MASMFTRRRGEVAERGRGRGKGGGGGREGEGGGGEGKRRGTQGKRGGEEEGDPREEGRGFNICIYELKSILNCIAQPSHR